MHRTIRNLFGRGFRRLGIGGLEVRVGRSNGIVYLFRYYPCLLREYPVVVSVKCHIPTVNAYPHWRM